MQLYKKLGLLLLLSMLLLPLATSQVITNTLINYTNVKDNAPDSASGDTVRGSVTDWSPKDDGSQRGYLTYNLSSLSANCEVLEARWYGYVYYFEGSYSAGIYEVNLSNSGSQWGEDTLTWNNQATLGCGTTEGTIETNGGQCNATAEDTVTLASIGTWYSYNITAMTKKAWSNDRENVSFAFSATGGTGDGNYFYSREAVGNDNLKPFINVTCEIVTPPSSRFDITAIDTYDGSTVYNFTITIINDSGRFTNYTTTGSMGFSNISNGIYNISITKINDSGGYYDVNYTDYDVADDLEANLSKYFRALVSYSNFVEYDKTNYVRNLTYEINATCPSFSTVRFDRYINGVFNGSNKTFSCNDGYQQLSLYYSSFVEGNYTISTLFNVSYRPETNTVFLDNTSYLSDLYPPNITNLNFTAPDGFAPAVTNVTMICTDKVQAENLTYDLRFNGNLFFYGNLSNGTEQKNETTLENGDNIVRGVCTDFFSSTQLNLTKNIYKNVLYLIDEVDNTLFDVDNATGARVYFDSNRSFFDFKAQGTNQINFTTEQDNQLRFELIYEDGSVITRYVDVSLINGDVRVCANKEGVTHYQQLIIAATQKPAILKNLFSDCVIAADYTRFAYQDALVLQAFSIASLYYLYTLDDNDQQSFLAAMDGSISTYINLDQLEFGQTAYNLNLLQDSLTFEKTEDDEIQIYYNNIAEDNTALDFSITRMDTSEVVFSTTSFTNPNEFTLLFDYSTLTPAVNATVLFKAELIKTTETGTSTITKYFNTNAQTGILRGIIATVISILLTMFGLTLASARITFSWFGALIMIAAIGILTTAVMNWYVLLLMGIEVIMFVFIIIMTTTRNYPTIA